MQEQEALSGDFVSCDDPELQSSAHTDINVLVCSSLSGCVDSGNPRPPEDQVTLTLQLNDKLSGESIARVHGFDEVFIPFFHTLSLVQSVQQGLPLRAKQKALKS